jgi:hypothetical protein
MDLLDWWTSQRNSKDWITAAVVAATPEMLSHVWSDIEFWLDIYHVTNGVHVEINKNSLT